MSDQPTPLVQESEFDLFHVFAVMWRWKWLIAGGTLIVLVATWFYSVNLPKVYQVTVRMWPVYTPRISSQLASPDSRNTDAIIKSFIGFFQNYSLAESAIREFELDNSPMNLTPRALLGKIDVQLEEKTNLINFKIELKDPILAWEVANYMAREGIERYSQLVQEKITLNAKFLASQLDENRIQLIKDGKALVDFQQKANTRNLTGRKYFLQTQSDELASMIVETEIELAAKGAEILVLEDAFKGNKQSTEFNVSLSGEKISTEESDSTNDGLGSLRLLSKGLNDILENNEERLIRNKAEYASLKAGKEKMEQSKRETDAELVLIEDQLASVSVEEEKLRVKLELTNKMNELTELELMKSRSASELSVQQIEIVDSGGIPKIPIRPRVLRITALYGAVALTIFIVLSFPMEEVARRRKAQALQES